MNPFCHPVEKNDARRNGLGIPLAVLREQEMARNRRLEDHRLRFQTTLFEKDPRTLPFVVCQFTCYLNLDNVMVIPGEIGLTAFNIQEGIMGNFHSLIDVYEFPSGYGIEARKNCRNLCLPNPPFDNRLQDYKALTQRIEEFIKKYAFPGMENDMKVYCLPNNIKETNECFKWLYSQFGESSPIEMFNFIQAMFLLSGAVIEKRTQEEGINRIKMQETLVRNRKERDESLRKAKAERRVAPKDAYAVAVVSSSRAAIPYKTTADDWGRIRAGIFYTEQQVLDYLRSFDLTLQPELSCLYHMQDDAVDAIHYCSLNVTNRLVYNLLEVLSDIGKVEGQLGHHIPDIQTPQNETKQRETMLKKWPPVIKTNADFQCDPNKKPPFFKKHVAIPGPE